MIVSFRSSLKTPRSASFTGRLRGWGRTMRNWWRSSKLWPWRFPSTNRSSRGRRRESESRIVYFVPPGLVLTRQCRVSKKMSTDLRRMSSSTKAEDLTESSSSDSDQDVMYQLCVFWGWEYLMQDFHLRLTGASRKWTKLTGRNWVLKNLLITTTVELPGLTIRGEREGRKRQNTDPNLIILNIIYPQIKMF